MAVPGDDVSRFLFGLYRDAGAIRVRRAETMTLGEAQAAHTRRVIEAWIAATGPGAAPAPALADARSVPVRRTRRFGRLGSALARRLSH